MRTFAVSDAVGMFIRYHGNHSRPPSVKVDTPSRTNPTRRAPETWHHLTLRKYSLENPTETVYAMADDHCLRYLARVFHDNRIRTRFLVPRDRSETELLSLCPTVQVLSATNKLDDVIFPEAVEARIAVITQDLGFGDCLALLSALKEVEFRIRRRGLVPKVAIFANFCSPVIDLFRLCKSVAEIHLMPQPLSMFATYSAVIDLSKARFSCERCLVDSMLEATTINPLDVPRERKRVVIDQVPKPSARIRRDIAKVRQKYRRLVLLSPIATGPTRCMPLSAMSRLRLAMNKQKEWLIITTHPGLVPQGFLDLSYLAHGFTDFISIIWMCDAVISVDTSAFYVADGLNKPAVVLFTTNHADVWSAPYPKVWPIQVGQIGPLGDAHRSSEPNLVRYAESQWDYVDFDRVVFSLERTLQEEELASADPTSRSQPIAAVGTSVIDSQRLSDNTQTWATRFPGTLIRPS